MVNYVLLRPRGENNMRRNGNAYANFCNIAAHLSVQSQGVRSVVVVIGGDQVTAQSSY